MRRRDLLKAIPLLMTPSLARADTLPLRLIPNANLTALDPIWTTALVAQEHGYLVFDTLYGIDDAGQLRPQMCAGHELSDDKLTWTFTLRDGLMFHDGEKVLAKDCVMSLRRWESHNSFGQVLTAATDDIVVIDDRRFQIRLKKPFGQMLYQARRAQLLHDARAYGDNPILRAGQGSRRIGAVPVSSGTNGFPVPALAMRGSTATCRGRNRQASTRAARWQSSSGSNGSCSRTRRLPPPLCKRARWTGSSSR